MPRLQRFFDTVTSFAKMVVAITVAVVAVTVAVEALRLGIGIAQDSPDLAMAVRQYVAKKVDKWELHNQIGYAAMAAPGSADQVAAAEPPEPGQPVVIPPIPGEPPPEGEITRRENRLAKEFGLK